MAKFEASSLALKSGQKVLIRSVAPEDAAAYLKFRAQIPHESTHTYQYVGIELPSLEEMTRRLRDQEADPVQLNLGAFDDSGRIVGYLNFRMPWPDHPWLQHVASFGMMVSKDYWGGGIGKRLLELQEIHARAHGITRIEAMVRTANERGVKLYTRRGYQIEGTRQRAAKIDGRFQDEYFIAKILDGAGLAWKPPTIRSDRLFLRPLEISDAEAVFGYAKNPNVCRYTLWETHQNVKDSLDYIQDYAFKYYAEGVPEPYAITLKDAPETVIGTVGCFWTSRQAKAMELAYALSEDQWGKGLAAEASRAVMDYCFEEFALNRIQARCKAENRASARVMEKIGMTFEGTFRSSIFHRDRYWDMHCYAELRR